MKMLFVIPSLSGGGAEVQTVLLAEQLTKRGHEVHVATWDPGPAEPLGFVPQERIHWQSIDGWRGFRPADLRRLIALQRRLSPTVVQTCIIPADLFGGIGALMLRIPWIIREPNGAGFAGGRPKDLIRSLIGRYADAIVANAPGGVALWRDWGAPEEKLRLVPNAVRVPSWDEVSTIAAEPPHEGEPQRRLLVVGRMVPQKDVETVTEVVGALMKDSEFSIRVDVFGEGPAVHLWEELMRRPEVTQGFHQLRLHGFRNDWMQFASPRTVLISTSLHEGRPNVPWEALGRGASLVLSDIEAHREISAIAKTGVVLVPVGDRGGFASAVSAAWERPTTHDVVRNRWAAANQYSVPALAASYEKIYEDVLEDRRK